MKKDDLIKILEDRKVLNVFLSMSRQMQLYRRPVRGGVTYSSHKAINLITILSVRCEFYENNTCPRNETFKDCKKRDSNLYDGFLDVILESINNYNVRV